ncbi:hypothetical protein AX15_005687 [Amanita polypyramis BW_CC]|nr:hypothetical protein AX15_005687 [Amanita polypyramis BW_CC]
MSFGRPPSINVGFKPNPPDRGAFPLDHYGEFIDGILGCHAERAKGECKEKMMLYMDCLRRNSGTSSPCRALSKDYLDCRMEKGLMERDEWRNLGLANVRSENQAKDVQQKSK